MAFSRMTLRMKVSGKMMLYKMTLIRQAFGSKKLKIMADKNDIEQNYIQSNDIKQ
jgi:hypothetical protein